MKLLELAVELGLKLAGDGEREVFGVASPEYPSPDRICVVWDRTALRKLPKTVPFIGKEEYFTPGCDGLISSNPRACLGEVVAIFDDTAKFIGIDPDAFISPSAVISASARVNAFAYIGEGCEISDETVIEPNAVLLQNVHVGRNCIIHSGAVIGSDGFGFERMPTGELVKIPQTGGVTIGDNVEIGACTTIDRGTMDDTEIGSGTKIDNHVQIGHNVKIGRNCIVCSMSGIAGSSVIGDNVTISVQAGITDHVTVGDNTVIAGRSGITNDIPPNSIISGFPARNHNDAKRALVLAADLPLLVKRLRLLERKVEAMHSNAPEQ